MQSVGKFSTFRDLKTQLTFSNAQQLNLTPDSATLWQRE